jgi:predicted nuclease with TOPRIM domain
LVADISEERMTPLDVRMEQLGGVVFRRARTLVQNTEDDRDAAAHRADMEQLKAERAQARADRLAKIDAKIDNLRVKLENAIERKCVKMQMRQKQREAKIQALRAKADQSEGEIRGRQEARIADLRRDYAEMAAEPPTWTR